MNLLISNILTALPDGEKIASVCVSDGTIVSVDAVPFRTRRSTAAAGS